MISLFFFLQLSTSRVHFWLPLSSLIGKVTLSLELHGDPLVPGCVCKTDPSTVKAMVLTTVRVPGQECPIQTVYLLVSCTYAMAGPMWEGPLSLKAVCVCV